MIRSAEQALDAAAGCAASLTRCGVWPFGPDCGPELLPQLVASDLEKKRSAANQPGTGQASHVQPFALGFPPSLFLSAAAPDCVCIWLIRHVSWELSAQPVFCEVIKFLNTY